MIGILLLGTLELAAPVSANVVQTTGGLDVSSAGGNAGGGDVAFDPSGNALMVWSRVDALGDSRVQLRVRSASGSLGTTQTLSAEGRDAVEPRIAVDATGDAVIAWLRFDGSDYRVQAVRRKADGTLSSVKTLSPAGEHAESTRIAVDPAGNAYVVWLRWDGSFDRVQLRRRSVGGTLSDVQTISPAADAQDPQVAVDANGNAYVAWYSSDGSDDRVQLRRRSSSGALGTTVRLSAAGQDAKQPRLAVDPNRNVLIAWERFDGANWRIELRRRATDGTLSSVAPLSDAGQNANNPAIASSAGGTVIAWERFDGTSTRIQAVRRDPSGGLGSVATLSAAGAQAANGHVAIDATGDIVVAWRRWDGTNFRVQAVRRSSAGLVGDVITLSAAGQHAAAGGIALDHKGNAVVTWNRSDGTHGRVQASYLVQFDALSEPGLLAGPAEVAVDSSGNALVSWWRQPYLDARRRSAAGAVGGLHHVNTGGWAAQNQHVAFDPDGNAFITWIEHDNEGDYRVKLVRRTPGGTYGAVQTLSADGQDAFEPQLAVDGQGRVYVVWRQQVDGTNRIQLRRRSAGGTLSAVQTLSAAGQWALSPAIAVSQGGTAIVAWQRSDGASYRIQVRRRGADGTLGTTKTLSAAGQDAFDARLAMDSDGDVVIVWRRSDGTHTRVQAARRTASGTYSSIKTLSAAGQHAGNAEVAVDPAGNALVVWSRSDGSNTRIQLVRRSPGGTLSSVVTLSGSGQNADVPAIDMDSSGRAVIAWTRFDGANRRLQALRRSAGGTLGPVQTLSPAGEDAGETTYNGPKIAATGGGKSVIITWYRSNGSSSVVKVLRF